MYLVRDVLDKQLLDVNRKKIGKVDGIVLSLRPGAPPQVAVLQSGPAVLLARVSRRLAALVGRLEGRLGIGDGRPLSVPMGQVLAIGIDVQVAVVGEETCAWAWERWLREHVVGRLPGAGKED